MKTIEQLRRELEPTLRRLVGATRRMVIGLHRAGAKWRLDGHDHVKETVDAEVFSGIGFTSRPPAGQGEVIVVFPGGPNHGCIVATRDEKTRAAIAGALEADETATFNSQTIVLHKADGTIEARSSAGVAVPLATKADVDAVVLYLKKQFDSLNGHAHATPSGPTTTLVEASGTSNGTCPAPTGTTVLKGE